MVTRVNSWVRQCLQLILIFSTRTVISAGSAAHSSSVKISVDVKHPYRLILACDHDETPRKLDGGLDWVRITKVQVLEIVDTH